MARERQGYGFNWMATVAFHMQIRRTAGRGSILGGAMGGGRHDSGFE
jgi:hypothetical protein